MIVLLAIISTISERPAATPVVRRRRQPAEKLELQSSNCWSH